MEYDDRNSGALFKNEYKKSDKAPDLRGPFTGPNGEKLEMAAWARVSKSGKKFFSVKISEPFKKDERQEPAASSGNDFLEDGQNDW